MLTFYSTKHIAKHYLPWQCPPRDYENQICTRTGLYDGELNTMRRRHNGRRFADETFSNAFSLMKLWILHTFSLKFVSKGSTNDIPTLVQIMAWCRSSDNPLSGPMMESLLTHISVTRPQCVKFGFLAISKTSVSSNLAIRANNILRPQQNGRHFTDNIFKYILCNVGIPFDISLRFVPKGHIDNKLALV